MARKRRHHEEENHERWLVSYADFITLLFAFFVVMYAVSSVNEGKYRVLTETLGEAFTERLAGKGGTPVGVESGGALIAKPENVVLVEQGQGMDVEPQEVQQEKKENIAKPEESKPPPQEPPTTTTMEKENPQLAPESATLVEQPAEKPPEKPTETPPEKPLSGEPAQPAGSGLAGVAEGVRNGLAELISNGSADVRYNERWIEVNLSSQMMFESGEARLGQPALRALRDLGKLLRDLPNVINVEGYTDNKPIRTEAYPSNWELSSARAASVVHYLARLGVDPSRLAAVGFGEFRPRADNATEEGRAKNRRIAILIMADGGSRDRPPSAKPDQGVTP